MIHEKTIHLLPHVPPMIHAIAIKQIVVLYQDIHEHDDIIYKTMRLYHDYNGNNDDIGIIPVLGNKTMNNNDSIIAIMQQVVLYCYQYKNVWYDNNNNIDSSFIHAIDCLQNNIKVILYQDVHNNNDKVKINVNKSSSNDYDYLCLNNLNWSHTCIGNKTNTLNDGIFDDNNDAHNGDNIAIVNGEPSRPPAVPEPPPHLKSFIENNNEDRWAHSGTPIDGHLISILIFLFRLVDRMYRVDTIIVLPLRSGSAHTDEFVLLLLFRSAYQVNRKYRVQDQVIGTLIIAIILLMIQSTNK